jgi:hypothetical protein
MRHVELQRREPSSCCSGIRAHARPGASARPQAYRGDYDREGKTTRDTWGGYASGKAQVSDLEIFGLGSFDGYKRFRDQDTDFTPDIMFEVTEADKAWQSYEELHVGRRAPTRR